jgi:hypothetical protein
LQLFWYIRQNEFPRFVLLGVLRMTDLQDQEFEKRIKMYGKIANAKKIQRRFRAHLYFRYERGACRIQCMARNVSGSNLVDKLRKEKWANRKLRHWVRAMMKKRNKASSKIAFAWYHGKRGRFLQHLITMNDRTEQREHYERRQKLNLAATVLQAVIHGVWTRRIIVRTKFAIKIEKVSKSAQLTTSPIKLILNTLTRRSRVGRPRLHGAARGPPPHHRAQEQGRVVVHRAHDARGRAEGDLQDQAAEEGVRHLDRGRLAGRQPPPAGVEEEGAGED